MTRTVDSSFEVNGETIETDMYLNRFAKINPSEYGDPKADLEAPEETSGYNTMVVKATYLDGEWVQERSENSPTTFPDPDDIYKTKRYVKLVDFQTEYTVYVLEEKLGDFLGETLFVTE